MIISDNTNDQLMVTAAVRYCLDRRSYIVGACCEWIKEHWTQFSKNTQQTVVRDIVEQFILYDPGMECDQNSWLSVIRDAVPRLDSDQMTWLRRDLAHRVDVDSWLDHVAGVKA